MIVNSLEAGWEILSQRAHALLAAELASYWVENFRPPRWLETLVAIAQHDDQEAFWQGHHLSELGVPLNFDKVPLNPKNIMAREVIANAQLQSGWVALLIVRHNRFLYDPQRGQNKDLDQFLDELRSQQEQLQKQLDVSTSDLERWYTLVNWSDRLSLILCQRQIPARERALEITTGPDGERHMLVERPDGTLQITPWKFTHKQFTVQAETRLVKQLQFESTDHLRQCLENAPVVMREWTFVR